MTPPTSPETADIETIAGRLSEPRDGRVIIVGHPDVGEYAMAWNARGTNEIFAAGDVGIWEAADRSFTWRDGPEHGPSYWMPLAMGGEPACRQPMSYSAALAHLRSGDPQ